MSTSKSITSNLDDEINSEELEFFLKERGCSPVLKRGLVVAPVNVGSGYTDTAIQHDQVLVEQKTERQL